MNSLLFSGLILLIVCTFVHEINGHNYLTNPVSRGNQKSTQTGCRFGGEGNPTCSGPCDRTVNQINQGPISIQRGETIQLKWYRHTHPGGFIRVAWSPTSQSDVHSSFDQRVDRIVCKETGGCGPSDAANPSSGSNGVDCGITITVPLYVTNGAWTLQWAYFGGWWNAGDYYACVDYTITGGPTGTQSSAVFIGGDYTYPNENVCLFYSTNALHVCTAEPCNNGTFPPGNQKGAALGFGGSTPGTTGKITTGKVTTKAPSVTTGKVTTGRITTGAASVTTGKVTTGKVSVTTGKITTGKVSTTKSNVQSVTTLKSTTAKITSGKLTTGIQGVDTVTTSSTEMCYKTGTPNLNGKINANPPTCGKTRGKGRCVEGQCCSQYGYCGPFADSNGRYFEDMNGVYQEVTQQFAFSLYCNNHSIADYRKVPCNTLTSFSNDALTGNHGDKLASFASSMKIKFSEFILVLFFTCLVLSFTLMM